MVQGKKHTLNSLNVKETNGISPLLLVGRQWILQLFTEVMFHKVAANTEPVNTEPPWQQATGFAKTFSEMANSQILSPQIMRIDGTLYYRLMLLIHSRIPFAYPI